MLLDVVNDAIFLKRRSGQTIEFLAIEISDAFNNIPVNSKERRFLATKVGDMYVLFTPLVFGAGSSPTVWERFAAFAGRFIAALFSKDRALLA